MTPMLTEKEAHEKWCPMTVRNGSAGVNGVEPLGTVQCIASNCMAWRWAGQGRESGYCGLAQGTERSDG